MVLAGKGLAAVVLAAAAVTLAAAGSYAVGGRPAGLKVARIGAFTAWAAATGAVALLVAALLLDRFELLYVAANSERAMTWYYKVAALWSGQAGSLLFWLWLLTGYLVLVARRRPPAVRHIWPWALALFAGVTLFWSALTVFVENPFRVTATVPVDGMGMNPLLRHPGMLIHPLMVYLAYTGFTVPFVFALAALIARRPDTAWFRYTRRWTVSAWAFLTVGILAGAQWAYDVLGWGGYWGWDPVENSSLMPWLAATAFLHSAMVQEKRGMLKNWNLLLIVATYVLSLVGILITRSGLLASVHAFAQSPIGPWFIVYLALVCALTVYLVLDRRQLLQSRHQIESYLSRESGFLVNNLLLAGSAFTVLWGTLFPLAARIFGREINVGAPYFNRVNGPVFLALVFLTAIGPLLAWRRTQPASLGRRLLVPGLIMIHVIVSVLVWYRDGRWGAALGFGGAALILAVTLLEMFNAVLARVRQGEPWWRAPLRLMVLQPRRYGGYIVHLGLALLVIGVVATQYYARQIDVGLLLGREAQIGRYSLTYQGLTEEVHQGVPSVYAQVLVREDGRDVAVLRPARRFYPRHVDTMGPVSEVAVMGNWSRDLYVVLGGWEPDGTVAAFQIHLNPMAAWIWIGGYVMVAGSVLALWPERRPWQGEEDYVFADLAELDQDFAAGKMDEETYQSLRAELLEQAVTALRRQKEAGGGDRRG